MFCPIWWRREPGEPGLHDELCELCVWGEWDRFLSGGETCTDPQGGYPSGCRLSSGGSGPKSVGGSSWVNSELDENGKDTVVLDWFGPTESKTLRLVWLNYAWKEISP
jgi:hypothetical protein